MKPRVLWLVVPLSVIAFLPFLGGGLLTDDFVHVERVSRSSVTSIIESPDAFGFFRPVSQATLKLDTWVYGRATPGMRVTNLALHVLVLIAASWLARLVSGSDLAAAFATAAFALTPKAHPIAVLWISARNELLMALFTLVAVAAWIVWTRHGRVMWLIVAVIAYALAALSKETAFVLPLILLATPGAQRPWSVRLAAVLVFVGIGAGLFMWRTQAGALSPLSGDAHYNLATPLERSARNLRNYTLRMLPGPAALLLPVGVVAMAISRKPLAANVARGRMQVATFAVIWSVAFLAPVLPIVLRSEIYLYVPVFGLCLLAGLIFEQLVRGIDRPRMLLVPIVVSIFGLLMFQATRSREFHRDLDFSAKLVAALERRPELAQRQLSIALTPADPVTARFLHDAIGGYLTIVLQYVFGKTGSIGSVDDANAGVPAGAVRVVCRYENGTISLTR